MASEGCCGVCGAPLPRGAIGERCARCLLETGLARNLAQADELGSDELRTPGVRRFGDYELFEEIGRGGMGVVYRARQISLNRTVAVKMLLAGPFASPEYVRRFRVEAESAASLHHPNIVAIHEFGEKEGQPYFSMNYVAGRNLADIVRERSLAAGMAAGYTETIARAIHYAHQQGTVHRDLKPSNILIDAEDEPRITDFGLAKRQMEDAHLTITGQTLGSPSYISPEQAIGKQGAVGPGSDIYSLGAILYHLVTGRPPFLTETLTATLRQVQETEPVAPRLLNPGLPRDLEIICLKCLEKDPARRFGSALELADELRRFLKGEPILTRPVGLLGRIGRWGRRNPTLAALAGTVGVLAMMIAVGAPVAIVRIRSERDAALRHANEETKQRQLADATLRRLEIQRAKELFASDRAAGAIPILAFLLRQDPTDRATAEWLVNELTYRSFALPVVPPLQHDDMVFSARFSPDGRRLLTACRDNSAYLWDAATGQPLTPPLQHDPSLVRSGEFLGPLRPLFSRFNPQGTRVVTASIDHTARLWDALTGAPVTPPLLHPDSVIFAQFSPDGRLVVTTCEDGVARLWDTSDGHSVGRPLKHARSVESAEFSPDGQWVVTASEDATAQVWEVQTGERVGPALRHAKSVRHATFSPDGRQVATVSSDYTARIWNPSTGEPTTPPLRHEGILNSADFSPDGRWLVTCAFDKTARVWDTQTGESPYPPLKHNATVRCACFSPEGYRIVTGSEDGTARVWNVKTGEPITEPLRHGAAVWSAQFSPDGQRVVTASLDKTVQVWDVRPGQALSPFHYVNTEVKSTVWSRDGQRLLITSKEASILNVTNGVCRIVARHEQEIVQAELSPDGRRLVTASPDGTARIWDAQSGQVLTPLLRHHGTVYCARFSPDGESLVTASADHTACVWNAQTGELRRPAFEHSDVVYAAEFSPDGRWVLTACADKQARVWDLRTGQPNPVRFKHENEVTSARFSPAGTSVVTASKDNTARVWDARDGRPLSPPLRHNGVVTSVRFSPDGRCVVTSSADKTARVWDARTGEPITEPLNHEGKVSMADFSPDSRRVVTASDDGTVRVWDARTGQPFSGPLKHPREVSFAQFSPDGRWLATACLDRKAYLWELTPSSVPIPDWMLDLAEAVAGGRLNPQRSLEAVPVSGLLPLRQRLAQAPPADAYTAWAGWFLADRVERRLSPSARQTVRDWFEQWKLESRWKHFDRTRLALWEALRYMPDSADLHASLARLMAEQDVDQNPRFLAEADWLSRRALALEPNRAEVWWARAVYSSVARHMTDVVEMIERASRLAPDNVYICLAKGRLLEKAGRQREAGAAFDRAHALSATADLADAGLEYTVFVERTKFLERQGHLAEAQQEFRRHEGIIPRDPATPNRLIDLWPAYNAGLAEEWMIHNIARYTLSRLPRGRQTFAGVEFDVRALVQLSGAGLLPSWPTYPEKVEAIPVGQKCRRLHFLHAVDGIEPDGTQVGSYLIQYVDGQRQEIQIVYGRDVVAWNLDPPLSRTPPIVAWQGENRNRSCLQLFKSSWDNPRPDVEVKALDFVSAMTRAAPFLVAVTAEP